jgi:ABC-2 type transport system ATP-binding protein
MSSAHDPGSAAVVLDGIVKSFGSTIAVQDLQLIVPRGGLYGIIGPNGAGKTTTLRMIMSILFPDNGTLSVLGRASALEAKDRIGYLPEERGVYRKMKVGAFLVYIGRLKGMNRAALPARIDQLLERVGLGGVARKRCEELSKGMLQKVQFVAATLHEPELLILDEPFSGLDPVSTRQLRAVIEAEHRRGATILLSTHVMPHAEELCNHVVMFHRGRKVLDESIASIRGRYDPRTIRFEPLHHGADLAPLARLDAVERLTAVSGGCEILLKSGVDPGAAIGTVASAVPPSRIELARARLEDVFVRIVSDDAGTDERTRVMAQLADVPVAEGV